MRLICNTLSIADTPSQNRTDWSHANVPLQPICTVNEWSNVIESVSRVIPQHELGFARRTRVSLHRSFIEVLLKSRELKQQRRWRRMRDYSPTQINNRLNEIVANSFRLIALRPPPSADRAQDEPQDHLPTENQHRLAHTVLPLEEIPCECRIPLQTRQDHSSLQSIPRGVCDPQLPSVESNVRAFHRPSLDD